MKTRAELLELCEVAYDELEIACREMEAGEFVNAQKIVRGVQATLNDLEEDSRGPEAKAARQAQTNLRLMQEGFARAFFEKTGCGPWEAEMVEERRLDESKRKVEIRWFFRRKK